MCFYNTDSQTGKGATSEVYKGIETLTRKPVAIKVVFLEKLTNTNQIASCENEAQILKKLDNVNIVKLFDSGQVGIYIDILLIIKLNMQYKYLVLEHCELGALQLNKPLSEDKSRDLFRQLLSGLSFLKSLRILHRDLKVNSI
jgi:serine/threonine protein kinase